MNAVHQQHKQFSLRTPPTGMQLRGQAINNQLLKQEAFEKCWAHSPQRAASRQFTRCR